MKKIFVDTNILVDLIADRQPFSKYAIEIFTSAERRNIMLFTSSHSIATTFYLLKKHTDDRALRKVIYFLMDYIKVLSIDEAILKKGLQSKFRDFEDAVQIFCAMKIESMDFIVTRNPRDFKDSPIPVVPPDQLCLII